METEENMLSNALIILTKWVWKLAAQASQTGGQNFRKLIGSMTLLGFVSANSSGCAQTIGTVAKDKEAASETTQVNFDQQNQQLVDSIREKGVKDEKVLKALVSVPRHVFVPDQHKVSSYDDNPLPIGEGQTISQPYIVAFMTEALKLDPQDKVLEIGTGSGYQACVLARLAKDVYSIEIIPELAERAKKTLAALSINNVHVKTGDGYLGWPEQAPFDAIIVTAAPPEIPQKLVEQLKVGGRLVVPVGDYAQWLVRLVKQSDGTLKRETLLPVRFVPMVPSQKAQ